MCNECHLSIDMFDIAPGAARWVDDRELLHCLDGPALIWEGGVVYCHGLKHRDGDEPAMIYNSGRVEYWVNGKRVKKCRG